MWASVFCHEPRANEVDQWGRHRHEVQEKIFFSKKIWSFVGGGCGKTKPQIGNGNQFLVLKFACAGVLNFMVTR